MQCIICEESTLCVSCTNNHSMCVSCFTTQVRSQISSDSVGKFVLNNAKIVCSYCAIPFDDLQVIRNIDDTTYEAFAKAKEDVTARKTEEECERRFKETQTQSKILQHKTHICENILTIHCKRCNAAVLDFDGCFAVECVTCKANWCAWCLKDCGTDAHEHVKHCQHSLCQGSVHGTLEQFNDVHKKRKKCEVIAYLDTILDVNDKNKVISLINKDLMDLGIDIGKKDIVIPAHSVNGANRNAQHIQHIEERVQDHVQDHEHVRRNRPLAQIQMQPYENIFNNIYFIDKAIDNKYINKYQIDNKIIYNF